MVGEWTGDTLSPTNNSSLTINCASFSSCHNFQWIGPSHYHGPSGMENRGWPVESHIGARWSSVFLSQQKVDIWLWIKKFKEHFIEGLPSINPSYFDVHQGYKVLTHPQIFIFEVVSRKKKDVVSFFRCTRVIAIRPYKATAPKWSL